MVENSESCKIPETNRDFWVAKIRRNKECDKEDQKKLSAMGWHCITMWECELKPAKREDTLKSLAYTLNKIILQDRNIKQYEMHKEMPLIVAEEITNNFNKIIEYEQRNTIHIIPIA